MDWTNIVKGLGNFGDIVSGKESYNAIKRGNQNYALGQDTLAQQANLAQQQRALQEAMQNAAFLNAEKLQNNSQRFQGDQNAFNRFTNTYENNADRIARMSEGSANRAAQQRMEDARLQNTVDMAADQRNWLNRPVGAAGSEWGVDPNMPIDVMSRLGAYGSAVVGKRKLDLEEKEMKDMRERLNRPKPASFWDRIFGGSNGAPVGRPVNPTSIDF